MVGRARVPPSLLRKERKKKKRKKIQSPSSQCSSKKIMNSGLCVVCWFVQGSIVMFLVKKRVSNCINAEPVFHRDGTFSN